MSRDRKYYCVYIMGSLSGTLYIGVSGNLHRRVFQHKFHQFEGFTDRYEVVRLLYFESYDDVHKALAREKQLRPADIDGFTPEQQFFIAWGQFRGDEIRIETQRLMMQTDPHPVAKYRVIGPLSNLPEFQKAWSCKAD